MMNRTSHGTEVGNDLRRGQRDAVRQSRGHDSDEIREDIGRTREGMDHTIDRIQEHLAPGAIVDRAVQWFERDGGRSLNEATHRAARVLKSNPVPAALIAAGVGWAVYDRLTASRETVDERPGRLSRLGRHAADEVARDGRTLANKASKATKHLGESAAHTMRDAASSVAQSMRSGAAHAGAAARHAATDAKASIERGAREAQESVRETYDRHPLAVASGLAAAGIAIGLAMPRTRQENEVAGDASDTLTGRRSRGASDDGTAPRQPQPREVRARTPDPWAPRR